MIALLFTLLGALIGAIATGVVQVWQAWQGRKLQRSVAARVILGDLFISEAMLDIVLKYERWPDRLDLDRPVATWGEFRADFAAGVKAWEWALVDSFYSGLHRASLMVRLGEPCTSGDLAVVAELRESAESARHVAAPHAVPKERERREVLERLAGAVPELEAGRPSDLA